MSLLRVQDLSKDFGGVRAVENLAFAIPAGSVFSIIGPNGAGKTTLLNLLSGIYLPTRGTIVLEQLELTGRPPHEYAASGIARTFQNLQLFMNMSAIENVMVGGTLRERCGLAAALLRLPALARAERQARARAAELMVWVGLADQLDAMTEELPYGSLKRLEIARALASRPRLLLLDEPAAGLNATETREVDALITRLARSGVTVVLVEHNMRLVMGVSDHILVLDHGKRLAEGAAREVRHDPRVIEAYLGHGAAAC
jgi:branched-chain amino acid transport system ATP-binding protein